MNTEQERGSQNNSSASPAETTGREVTATVEPNKITNSQTAKEGGKPEKVTPTACPDLESVNSLSNCEPPPHKDNQKTNDDEQSGDKNRQEGQSELVQPLQNGDHQNGAGGNGGHHGDPDEQSNPLTPAENPSSRVQLDKSKAKDPPESGLLSRVSDFCCDHKPDKVFDMTFAIGTFSAGFGWFLGAMTTYYLFPPQNHVSIEHFTKVNGEAVWENFKAELDRRESLLKKEFEANLSQALTEYIKNFNNSIEAKLPRTIAEQIEKLNNSLTQQYKAQLKNSMDDFSGAITKEILKESEMCKEMINSTQDLQNKKMESKTTQLEKELLQQLDTEKTQLTTRQDDLDQRLALEPQRMEIRGFMTVDSWGPILLVMACLEIILTLGICRLFLRRDTNQAPAYRLLPNGNADTHVMKEKPKQLTLRPIDITSNIVAFLCFRSNDADICEKLGGNFLEGCERKPNRLTHVVNHLKDVENIPSCRAALVFVEPDEREMILEDPRYVIGQGLRRHAVQRLLESGVEVFIIIFNDKNSARLNPEHLYNKNLGQIEDQEQLKKLKGKNRVLSIKDAFTEKQMRHLVTEFNRIY